MKLAVEKDSPIRARSIFFSNLRVVVKTLAIPVGFMLVLRGEDFTDPVLIAGLILWAGGLVGIGDAWRQNIALRRLKYSGILTFRKAADRSGRWISTLSPFTSGNPLKSIAVMVRLSKLLGGKAKNDDIYAQIAMGLDPQGELAFQVVHRCDPRECEKAEIHAFGYNEDRDGAIYWN